MNISRRMLSMVLAVILALSCMTICVFADEPIKEGVAFVDATALRLRSGPSTGSSIVDTAYDNEVVVILGQSGEWYKVIYNLQEGYMHSAYLDLLTKANVELGYGMINAYTVNMRSGPSTSHSVIAKSHEGDKAYILGIDNGWYQVIFKDQVCYVRSDLLDLTEYPYENRDSSNTPKYYRQGKPIGEAPGSDDGASDEETENTESSRTAVVNASALYLRAKPTTASAALDKAYRNETVTVLAQEGDWYKVIYDGQEGYMHGDYLIITETVSAGQKIVDRAEQYLGVPYVWGGSSPSGFDCSGFVQYVLRESGITIGRTCKQQWTYGTQISKEQLQPGDLVFFDNTYTSGISHVGIYVGDGQFIHSSSSKGVVISNLSSNYYTSHYYGARRIV